MSEVDLVWLVDADPPSDMGGSRGFYPESTRTDPPDESMMQKRFAAIRDVVVGEAGGRAVLTIHTSPRFRTTFFQDPYAGIARAMAAEGVTLALHPHEDRADGGSLYDDPAHLASVIVKGMAAAHEAGLPLCVFRSGGFAFHPCLPPLLAAHGLSLDLSAAPGLADVPRHAVWSRAAWQQDHVLGDATAAVKSVPIGWDGAGTNMDRNYLYNEKHDLAGLCRIWDALRANVHRPRAVNFLTHGFGLVEERFRRQAALFLRYATEHGGRLVSARALSPTASPA